MEKFKSITITILLIVVFLSVINPAFAKNPMRITTEENVVSVHTGSRVLMRYNYANVPFKPCVYELFSPRGVNVLRDAPADHLHHHALMYAVSIDGVNFWEEQQAPGRQSHRSFANIRIDKQGNVPGASFTEQLNWVNPRNQELMLKEQRTIKVCQPDDFKVTLLSWQSRFVVPSGKESVTLTGSHYFGLGMRFLKSMDTGGALFNAEGKAGEVVRGDERLVRADWCAYSAKADGKVVTVAMFGHPDNLRHPTQWFTMTKPFAYLSATLNLYREPLKVASNEPLVVRYGVALWDGRVKAEQIDQLYRRWVAWPLDATPPGSTNAPKKQILATGDARERLAVLEQKIVAAAKKAKRSVIRIAKAKRHPDAGPPKWFSGVIFTADGYVATHPYGMDDLPPGEAVSIHLADGRRVSGVVVGSSLRWGFGLVKISQEGHWPHAEIGSSAEVKLGEVCLALCYPRASYHSRNFYDREPSLRMGLVAMKAEQRWFSTSCTHAADRCIVFDLRGRLVGTHTITSSSDCGGHLSLHPTIEIVQQHWRRLVRPMAPVEKQPVGPSQSVAEPSSKAESPSVPAPDDPQIAPAIAKARKVTIRIDYASRHVCSGVVVSSDGYVATCAHHFWPPGTDVTIRFSDGREVPGKILGSDYLFDVGLAKITAPGPWPHAQWGSTTAVKPGDLCFEIGYPGEDQPKKGRPHPDVKVGRIAQNWDAVQLDSVQLDSVQLDSAHLVEPGCSGGGLFDAQGRLIAVNSGGDFGFVVGFYKGSDLIKRHWQFLLSGPSLGKPLTFSRGAAGEAFRKAAQPVPPITVEVLGDDKRRALGTIVSTDGYILTKASELYGSISCRLADGRTLPVTKVKTSPEYDLALLKIDAAGLPQIRWSPRRQLPVGSFVGAIRYGAPPVVGVVALGTHSVPRAPGWLVLGKVKDAKHGVEVEELWGDWPRLTPLRKGDVIIHVEGHRTPNVGTFEQVTKRERSHWEVPSVIAGDPIRVGVKRDGKDMELRFPLLAVMNVSDMESTSPRSCAFPTIFDTDAIITRDTCGGPVVDRFGEVVGITIALATEERVYVVPAAVARKVFDQLRQ